MAKDTIGQAYVQILPTMDGFSNAMNSEGAKSGKIAGRKMGGTLVSTVGKIATTLGIGATIAKAFTEGGKLQQSVGGIETLFKGSADIVKKNAKSAFKEAGMSANEYMENTTSFAAALISSCGGNTKEAAKLADVAMKSMSDNANKMGTDLDSITGTYQSLARGNYAMLDNLKLGYGGTKSEMERLMSDAEKLTGEHYTVGDFGDTVKAIKAVQDHLGITGTTAKEASTTLQGAFGMVKSSFSDLLGNLTTGGDISESFSNLFSSLGTLIGRNVIPMAGKLVGGLGNAIATADWSSIGVGIVAGASNALGQAATVFTTFAPKVSEWIMANDWAVTGQSLWNGFVSVVTSIDWGAVALTAVNLLIAGLNLAFPLIGGILNGVFATVSNVVNGIGAKMSSIWESIKTKTSEIWNNGIKQPMVTAMEGSKQRVQTAVENMKNGLVEKWESIKEKVKTTWENVKKSITEPIGKAWTKVKEIVEKIKGKFEEIKSMKWLKVPSITFTTKTILNKEYRIPTGISWNAKAMANPYMFSGATLFGAGEAGDEILYGRNSLMRDIAEASGGVTADLLKSLVFEIIDRLDRTEEMIMNAVIKALDGLGIKYDKREIARLVKEVLA